MDGSSTSFADVILQKRVCGRRCLIASYGFGVVQIRKVLSAFDNVCLVADISHAQLNPVAYNMVVEMSTVLPGFSFFAIKTHVKMALIDDEVFIFTSANLSANRRIESYVVGSFDEVEGIEKFEKMFNGKIKVGEKYKIDAADDFKVVAAEYLDAGDLNEAGYTHVVDDRGRCSLSVD